MDDNLIWSLFADDGMPPSKIDYYLGFQPGKARKRIVAMWRMDKERHPRGGAETREI